MNVQQVIEAGKISVDTSIFSESIWWWVIIGVLLLLSFLAINSKDGGEAFGVFFGTALLVFMVLLTTNGFHDANKESDLIEKWKKEVAMTYIASLPEEKKEIVYMKIDPELSHQTVSGLFYTYSSPIMLTPLTVSFKNNGIETYTNWYETYMKLTKEQKPYITYKKLNVDLGNGINTGMYDAKVYLPESYSFTDIK